MSRLLDQLLSDRDMLERRNGGQRIDTHADFGDLAEEWCEHDPRGDVRPIIRAMRREELRKAGEREAANWQARTGSPVHTIPAEACTELGNDENGPMEALSKADLSALAWYLGGIVFVIACGAFVAML